MNLKKSSFIYGYFFLKGCLFVSFNRRLSIIKDDNYSNVTTIFLYLIVNNCLFQRLLFGKLFTYLFLNISTVVKIEKRDGNCKRRGRYVWKDMKIESTVVSGPFMSLFSLFLRIPRRLWNEKPIHNVKLFTCLFFFQSQAESYSYMTFIFQFIPKNIHLCFSKHFHRGVFNFHLLFVVNTVVNLISNLFYRIY